MGGVKLTPPMKMERSVSKCLYIKFRCWGLIGGVKLTPPVKMEQSVSKRLYIKFRCWGLVCGVKFTPPAKMEQSVSETSAHNIQMLGTHMWCKAYTTHEDGTECVRNVCI